MAAAQLAWGGAQPGTAPMGSRAPRGVWGAPGLPLALLPQLPCPCLAPQGSSLRPLPPHLHLPAQPVPATSVRLPLLLWGPGLWGPGGGQRPARASGRASAGALRAWLGQHLRHPYPSRGEKAALAGRSSMSLAQVSTWFANARRRLRREKRLSRAPRGGEEGGEGPAGSPGPGESSPGPCPEPAPRGPSPSPHAAQPTPQAGLWSLAELATAPRPELSRCLPRGAALPCWGRGGAERATYVLAPRLGPALPL